MGSAGDALTAASRARDAHGSDVESDMDSSSDDDDTSTSSDDTSTSSVETVLEPQELELEPVTWFRWQEEGATGRARWPPRDFFDEVPERLHSLYSNTQEDNDELLCGAAQFGDVIACHDLIAHGANVNCDDGRGWSPLNWAIFCQPKPECIRFLLRAGALVTPLNLYDPGLTPLNFAIAFGKCTAVKMLLRAGAKFDQRHPHPSRTPQNGAAWALFDGWEEYVRQRKRMLAVFVAKLAPLPDDAARLVVDFYFGAVRPLEQPLGAPLGSWFLE